MYDINRVLKLAFNSGQVALRWNNENQTTSFLFYWSWLFSKDGELQFLFPPFDLCLAALPPPPLCQLFVAILLIFIVTDLMTWGTPFCLQVSHRMCVFGPCFCSASSGELLRFARPHWLNHHPVWLCWLLQLSTVRFPIKQDGLQPSLSTSEALNGAVSWFCSCS